MNAIGAAELSRFNADGYDINRDFIQFRTEEARLVRRVFDEFRPDFVLSLHEGPQDAAFMFANRHVDGALARRLLAALEAGGTTLATKDYFGLPLRPPGLSASSPGPARDPAACGRPRSRCGRSTSSPPPGAFPRSRSRARGAAPTGAARVRAHVDLTLALSEELH